MTANLRLYARGVDSAAIALHATKKQVADAQRRALSKLLKFATREVSRVVAKAIGTTQSRIVALARISGRRRVDGSVEIWIGTDPIAAQYLGKVSWRRIWPGAKAGQHSFPGAWSWANKPGAKTGAAVMLRTGTIYHTDAKGVSMSAHYRASVIARRYGMSSAMPKAFAHEVIAEVKLPIHDQVIAALPDLEARILARFETLLRQEINYATRVETRAA